MKDANVTTGERMRLRAFRVLRGQTQIKMAKICGVGLSTYNAIEKGQNDGKIKFWNNLQDKFKLTGEQLCKLQGKQPTREF